MIRRNFTLVEILTVIAIIAILMGLLLPVMSTAQRKGKENKARAAIQSIKFAIEQYENDYGILPVIGTPKIGTDPGDSVINPSISDSENNTFKITGESDSAYDRLMEILTLAKASDGTAYTGANSKKIRYIEAPANKVKDVKKNEGYFILDPWGRRYGIVIDNNYDGMIGNGGSASDRTFDEGVKTGQKLRAKVAVFSYGALKENAADDSTYHITSWK